MPRTRRVHLRLETLEIRTLLSTYFVAPDGDDSGPGTEEAPWLTLQRAANAVRAGDEVIVRPGEYAGFDLRTSGTADSPIRFLAEPGVVVTVPNPRTPDGINLEGASYVSIEGFAVVGLPRTGIRSVLNRFVTIRGNYLIANGKWGVLTGFSDDVLIEYNLAMLSQIEHGIYVSNSGDRPTIRGNYVWGNRSNGIHMNGDASLGGDGIISGALVEQNVIAENGQGGGSGINADGVQDSRFQNNLIYNTHASGISLYRIDGGDGSKRNVVVNNTVVVAADGRWALNIQNGSTDNTVYNNILYSQHPTRGSIAVSADSRPGFVSDHNAVMNRFSSNGGSTVIGLAQWRTATGQDANSVLADPAQLFVDADNGDFHLAAGSPALDAGTAEQAPTLDLDWNPRPAGPAWDIGAYEYWGGSDRQDAPSPGQGALQFLAAALVARPGGHSGAGGSTFDEPPLAPVDEDRLTREHLGQGIVSWLGSVVLVQGKGGAKAREGAGNPGIAVGEAPRLEGDAALLVEEGA